MQFPTTKKRHSQHQGLAQRPFFNLSVSSKNILGGIKRIDKRNARRLGGAGFSLVDTVMSLAVISILILVFANLLYIRSVNRRTLTRTQAAAVANEELSALKRFDITSLPNQTNGSFIGTLYNAGGWSVVADASAGNVLDLASATGFANAISGRLQFPAGSYGDATLQAAIKFPSDTAAGTAAGIFFRASDANNGYRLLVAPSGTSLDGGGHNWLLEKVVNGSAATPRLLAISVAGITTNTWYTIKVVASNTSLKTYLNGAGKDSGAITDPDFTEGAAALVGWKGVHAQFDDVTTVVGAITNIWDFDEALTLPTAWVRLGLNDLPDVTPKIFDDNGKLTLTPYPTADSTTLKQATIAVNWKDNAQTLSYTTTALLGSSHIGQ